MGGRESDEDGEQTGRETEQGENMARRQQF